jgi:hypothetical protein
MDRAPRHALFVVNATVSKPRFTSLLGQNIVEISECLGRCHRSRARDQASYWSVIANDKQFFMLEFDSVEH